MSDASDRIEVGLIAGPLPGAACGVTDYAHRLGAALVDIGVRAAVVEATDWSPRGFRRTARAVRKMSIVHLQHPSAAFQKRLGPYLLPLVLRRARHVLTLHEFSRKGLLGTALSYALVGRADRIVVTNEEEFAAVARVFPAAAARLAIIPIASNIPVARPVERTVPIAYFGQIRTGRGVETFLDVVARLGVPGACLIGSAAPGDAPGAALIARARALGVAPILDRPADEVAARLAATRVCLLPFPDGISERRGSALAAMANGAAVVTTAPSAPRSRALFAPLCLMTETADALPALVGAILSGEHDTGGTTAAARAFVEARSWPAIAAAHRRLYEGLA